MAFRSAPGGRAAGAARAERGSPALTGRAWSSYLPLAVALTPFVHTIGGTPVAWPDLVNGAALLAFAALVAARGARFELPLLPAVLVVAAGSLLAVMDAVAPAASGLALVQDAYLYAWTVLAVACLRGQGEAWPLRVTWAAVTAGVALGCLVESFAHGARFLSPRGYRALGTFGNSNMCAGHIVLGLFMWLGLAGRVRARWIAAGVGLLVLGLLATKSNGALCALAAGLAVWASIRAHETVHARRLAGVASLGLAVLLLGVWAVAEEGVGGAWLRAVSEDTVLGRMAKSSQSRGRIWQRLEHTLAHEPLGIGPGNSSEQWAEIGERERRDSMQSKEAHSDYVGYAVERGPLGLAGLLAGVVALALRLARGRRWLEARTGGARPGRALLASCAGALTALIVQSTVMEQLHFRHVWLFVALLWAMTGPAALAEPAPVDPPHRPQAEPGFEGHPA